MASNFDKVSRMNEAFGNAKGHPAIFDIVRLSKQLLSVPDELGETFIAMGADKQRVEALVTLFKAGLAALDFVNPIDVKQVRDGITDQHVFLYGAQHLMGINADADMDSVIGGLYTRFIKNEEDEIATIKKHASKGVVDVYFEGEYPVKIMKSSVDQPDAPKGKFMKSASYKEPVFYPVDEHCSISGRVFTLDGAPPTVDESFEANLNWLEDQPVIEVKFEVLNDGAAIASGTKIYSFEHFVQYGIDHGGNIVNGMPWSFQFYGMAVTHENNERYLICKGAETYNFTPKDILYVCDNAIMLGVGHNVPKVGKVFPVAMNDEARALLDRHNASIGAVK